MNISDPASYVVPPLDSSAPFHSSLHAPARKAQKEVSQTEGSTHRGLSPELASVLNRNWDDLAAQRGDVPAKPTSIHVKFDELTGNCKDYPLTNVGNSVSGPFQVVCGP